MSCDCNGASLGRVVILAVTTFLPDLNPPVLLYHSDNVPDLHGTSLSGVKPN